MALFGRKKKTTAPVEEEPKPTLPAPPASDENGLRPWEAHREYLLDQIEPLPPFGMQILDALGLSICEDIASDLDLPGFDNSAMDGYAVRAADTAGASEKHPITLAVVGEIAAGTVADAPLPPGTAMKIMTGAPVPEGADAVVQYELTDRGADDVQVFGSVEQGKNIRLRGSDIADGDQLLKVGHRLDARTVGLLAGIGIDKVLVRPRPRVVVVSTGTELVDPGLPLGDRGEIYDSNSYMLAAAAKAAGAQVFRVGLVSDDPDEIAQTISDQLVRADLIISSGGVSQGDWDVVKSVMPTLGLTDFTQVAMQPGKPQGFGLIGEDRIPMIMVPGNPVSAFVSFEAFVRPVIRKLMGVLPHDREPVRAITSTILRSPKGRAQFVRAEVVTDPSGRRMATPVGGASSHLLGSLQRSNALVVIDEDTEVVSAGEAVMVWMLDE
ncbi:molybdotransferase-like divisome protein Glp [Mariniluteicoccus flavus]